MIVMIIVMISIYKNNYNCSTNGWSKGDWAYLCCANSPFPSNTELTITASNADPHFSYNKPYPTIPPPTPPPQQQQKNINNKKKKQCDQPTGELLFIVVIIIVFLVVKMINHFF